MRHFSRAMLWLCMMVVCAFSATGAGWPSNYQGVMLQGFYWDSFTDTKWTNLEANADEYSKYFKLIWVPNSGKAAASRSMGYDPVYWFTNHNSAFGTEKEVRKMIQTYKDKGVGIIADVVINHRSGKSNWTDFPEEKWNGQTWKIGLDGICNTDEVNRQSNQAHGTGAADTGEDFDGSRDLDHTNANVQNNCKNYCKFLLTDMGYAGFRYDMTKGYGGQFTKIYNQYSNPTFSVGEYWDGSYDALAAWIEATGKTSATFDFAFKYAVNEAFSSNDMTKLCWLANGSDPQPAGLIHFVYSQYAVTFVDNHDTYRDDWNKFKGNVVAANAFMLCSPGTPCVFLPHWKEHKAELAKLIDVRNAVGVSNTSKVKVLRHDRDCYMAEVQGTKGKLVVKIGSAMASPSGYTDSQIKCSGNGYCVWSTTEGGGGGDDPVNPPTPGTGVNIYFDNAKSNWTTPHIHYWGASESVWPGVAMTKVEGNTWKYVCPAGTTGILFNAGDGDATKTGDFVAVNNHVYNTTGDQGEYHGGGDDPIIPPTPTADLYILGNLAGAAGWGTTPGTGVAMTKNGSAYTAKGVEFVAAAGETLCYFNLTDKVAATWDDLNAVANRYGSATEGEAVTLGTPASIVKYANNVDASGCLSWTVPAGKYDITADLSTMKLTVVATGGDDPIIPPIPGKYPETLYMIGDVNGFAWSTSEGVAANGDNGVYRYNNIKIDDAAKGVGYINLATVLGADWTAVNGGDRYGATEEGAPLSTGMTEDVILYAVNVSAMGCLSWAIPTGYYDAEVNLATMKISLKTSTGIDRVAASGDDAPVYFTLMGVRVNNPTSGIYLVRRGSTVTKEYVK